MNNIIELCLSSMPLIGGEHRQQPVSLRYFGFLKTPRGDLEMQTSNCLLQTMTQWTQSY